MATVVAQAAPQAVPVPPADETPTGSNDEKGLVVTPIHTYLYNMIELGIVRTFFSRQMFQAIPVESDISIKALADKTDVELALLNRFIQFLVLVKCLASPAPGRVAHTEKSRVFLYPAAVNFLSLDVDFFMGPATRWPDYFDENGWREPQSAQRTPLGLCYGHPDKSIYDVMPLLPGNRAAVFNAAMAATIDEMKVVGYYDFSWIAKQVGKDPKRTLIVDVGGGKGQALKAIIQENPAIPPQRCVLQDQISAINEAMSENDAIIKDIPKMISSFFEPQLIKGALVYHIRRVLNDYPDKEARVILQQCRDACDQDSTVLVSEQVLPDNPSLDLAAMDIFMMNYGGKRRTYAMFEELAGSAGLKIAKSSADKASGQTILHLVPV
ncbi:O-methyltransferase [Cordyceps fumosorosea ARSEF 2679]|uniref:O-methyltransferase n=1 Tax=Cordyceps fumosorosea (strain ARSEF 2679) TaxID=1081104 RepID=A0A167PKX3_CORFA|nr:O-methyltransferase [Cordyceps fumosorosea ARSEF 2679]OAA56764.1 O-methyltransferase [Cordyceps fumosorosea ARSEF 2679]